MSVSRERIVRARFVGVLCLFLWVPVCLAGMLVPSSILYTAGVALPFSYLTYRCFFAGAYKFSDVMSLPQYRIAYISSIAIGTTLHIVGDADLAIAWYISGGVFVFGEPIAQDCLVALGLGTRYSFDRDD
jgi:hypothetical protein